MRALPEWIRTIWIEMIGDWSSAFLRCIWSIIVTSLPAFNSTAECFHKCLQAEIEEPEIVERRHRVTMEYWLRTSGRCRGLARVERMLQVSETISLHRACNLICRVVGSGNFHELFWRWKTTDWHTDQPDRLSFVAVIIIIIIIITTIIIIIIIIYQSPPIQVFSSYTAFANHCHWFPGIRRLLLWNVLSGNITPYTRFVDLTETFLGQETNGFVSPTNPKPIFCAYGRFSALDIQPSPVAVVSTSLRTPFHWCLSWRPWLPTCWTTGKIFLMDGRASAWGLSVAWIAIAHRPSHDGHCGRCQGARNCSRGIEWALPTWACLSMHRQAFLKLHAEQLGLIILVSRSQVSTSLNSSKFGSALKRMVHWSCKKA